MNIPNALRTRLEDAEGLIFDMDGTVVDTMPLHYQAWSAVAEAYRLPFSKDRFYQLGGVPTYETLVILSTEAKVDIDIPAAKKMKETLYRAQIENVKTLSPVIDIIRHFYGKKPLAIATGSSKEGAQLVLGGQNLIRYFDAIVTADDVENHKPAPDVFLKAAKLIGIKADQCVAFEDTDIGIEAIQQASMYAVDVRDFV